MDQLKRAKYLMEFHFKSGKGTSQDERFPSYDKYISEIVNEEDPVGDEEQKTSAPAATPEPTAPKPAPAPAQEPMPAPASIPEPMDTTTPEEQEALDGLESQNKKIDHMLKRIEDIVGKVTDIEGITINSVNDLKREINDIKDPSYEEQLDLVSKNSAPYNIKLSDYFNWNDEVSDEEQDLEIKPEDIKDYSALDIKKSF